MQTMRWHAWVSLQPEEVSRGEARPTEAVRVGVRGPASCDGGAAGGREVAARCADSRRRHRIVTHTENREKAVRVVGCSGVGHVRHRERSREAPVAGYNAQSDAREEVASPARLCKTLGAHLRRHHAGTNDECCNCAETADHSHYPGDKASAAHVVYC